MLNRPVAACPAVDEVAAETTAFVEGEGKKRRRVSQPGYTDDRDGLY